MIKWLENKLVAGWRDAWRWASVQLAAVAAIIAGVLTAHPEILIGLIAFLPSGGLRLLVAAGVALVVFGAPLLTRLWQEYEEAHDGEAG